MFPVTTNVDVLIAKIKYRISRYRVSFPNVVSRWAKPHKLPTRPVLLLLFLNFFFCCHLRGTEIIVIIAADRVTLATDGLQRFHGRPQVGCKINQTGSVFWAAAGHVQDTGTGFNVKTFVDAAVKKQFRLQQMLDDIGVRIVPALQKELIFVKKEDPWVYQKYKTGGFILTLFAIRETGIGVETYVKGFPLVNDVVSANPAVTDYGIVTTYNPTLDRYIKTHNSEVFGVDDVQAIDRMMAVARSDDPESVGPPISILRVAPNSTHWLRQNNCPDIQTGGDKRPSEPANKKAH